MFYINPNGDRDADFSLIDLDPLTGDWKVSTLCLSAFELMLIGTTNSVCSDVGL